MFATWGSQASEDADELSVGSGDIGDEIEIDVGDECAGGEPAASWPIVALPEILTLGLGRPLMPGCKIYQGFCAGAHRIFIQVFLVRMLWCPG